MLYSPRKTGKCHHSFLLANTGDEKCDVLGRISPWVSISSTILAISYF